MKIKPYFRRWGSAWYLGPYIEWSNWNIYYHGVDVGLCLGPFIFYLEVVCWEKDWSKENEG